jgi:hypothetical protein
MIRIILSWELFRVDLLGATIAIIYGEHQKLVQFPLWAPYVHLPYFDLHRALWRTFREPDR